MKTERFLQLSADESPSFTHIPVVREVIADLDTPLSAYAKLCGDRSGGFLLESVQGGERWGRYSVVGLPVRREIRFGDGIWREYQDGCVVVEKTCNDPLRAVREYAARFRVPVLPGLPRFAGGLVGYFGAGLVRHLEPRLAKSCKPAGGTDDIRLMLAEDLVIFDNLRGSAFLVTHAQANDADAAAVAAMKLDDVAFRLRSPLQDSPSAVFETGEFTLTSSEKRFMESVDRVREYIRDGDVMQVVLSQRMDAAFSGRPLDVYRALRLLNPSPYLYFLDFGDMQVAGSSPEVLVRVEDGELTVRPIAGTRPRGATAVEDDMFEQELRADPKELAEHLMLVDLGRNDVGRVSEIGSVNVTERMRTERYSHVMHLVSNVTGKLSAEHDALDALAACFPAGTLSGAPKLRALEIIEELEPVPRGVYSGAIGYLGWQGNLDTAIAIRTAVIQNGRLQVQAGAGVVHDSDPRKEWEETLNKSRALLKAVEMVSRGMKLDGGA